MSLFTDSYDGRMPTMNVVLTGSGTTAPWQAENCIRAHYVLSQWDAYAGQIWMLLGCFFEADLIEDGKTFYCPATDGWMDEYLSYCGPAPWGSNLDLQPPNAGGSMNKWLRITHGYIYWPQGKRMCAGTASAVCLADGTPLDGGGYWRYAPGRPEPPQKASDVDMLRAMVVDSMAHVDDAGSYRTNALFPDGHTKYQYVPTTSDGRWICPYQALLPAGADPAEWYGNGTFWDDTARIYNYVYQLQL